AGAHTPPAPTAPQPHGRTSGSCPPSASPPRGLTIRRSDATIVAKPLDERGTNTPPVRSLRADGAARGGRARLGLPGDPGIRRPPVRDPAPPRVAGALGGADLRRDRGKRRGPRVPETRRHRPRR